MLGRWPSMWPPRQGEGLAPQCPWSPLLASPAGAGVEMCEVLGVRRASSRGVLHGGGWAVPSGRGPFRVALPCFSLHTAECPPSVEPVLSTLKPCGRCAVQRGTQRPGGSLQAGGGRLGAAVCAQGLGCSERRL